MPALQSTSSNVLVSGANGFLPMHVVQILLERGYNVTGTVRSEDKAEYIKTKYQKYSGKVTVVVVANIEKEGAFDEHVKGQDAVIHMASPFHFDAEDPQEMFQPALHGTKSMLNSIGKHGDAVQRVVITSSVAAVQETPQKPTTFNEADWNNKSIKECEEKGKQASGGDKYMASKSLAEKAAWQYHKEHNPKWDIATINPPLIFGPLLQKISSPNELNTSSSTLYKALVQEPDDPKQYVESAGSWIDVRDVALAHVLALETPAAGGGRHIISAGSTTMQDFIDAGNSLSPDPRPSKSRPKGIPGGGQTAKHMIIFDTARMTKIFGDKLKLRTKQETARDVLADYEQRGW